jgi:SAM-dependent methyltransferase
MDTIAKIRFLLRPASLDLMRWLDSEKRDNLSLAQAPALRGLPIAERAALFEQRGLRAKAQAKQSQYDKMVYTPLGLMQMTSEPLAKAKVQRLIARGVTSLADLGCGLGGDSMHIPKSIAVVGLEKDLGTLLAYRHNVGQLRPVHAVLGDALNLPFKVDACLVDPARRLKADAKHWDGDAMSPSLAALENLMRSQNSVGIKLGPGLNPPPAFEHGEWEYMGFHDSCLELMVWTGRLGESGMVRATELPAGATLMVSRQDRDLAFEDLATEIETEPGRYLYEPVKCVVRAHLHGILAQRHALRLLDPRIAYLTGDSRVDDPMLKRYALVRELPYEIATIRSAFKAADIGEVTVKKRGIAIIPEQIRAKVRHVGGRSAATLIMTRVGAEPRVFWVKPEGFTDSVRDGEAGLADDEMIAD